MLTINKSHPKQPVPDWYFKDGEQIHRAVSADKLIEKMVLYRRNNGMPPGMPEHEIACAYMVTHPWLVKDDGESVSMPAAALWSWVNRLWTDVPKWTTDGDEIKLRRATCQACPFSLPIPPQPELARRAYLLAQGNLQLETQCSHHRWHNGLAILLKGPEKWAMPDQPECCWLPGTAAH